jgi:hypothetical protein
MKAYGGNETVWNNIGRERASIRMLNSVLRDRSTSTERCMSSCSIESVTKYEGETETIKRDKKVKEKVKLSL